MRKNGVLIGLLFFSLIGTGHAAEPGCPGSANPNAAVVFCSDFENVAACPNGGGQSCWQANGWSSISGSWKIVPGQAAVGTGYAEGNAQSGGTGAGWAELLNFPGNKLYKELNYRYYVRFDDAYMAYFSMHGPAIQSTTSVTGCTKPHIGNELSQYKYDIYIPNGSACGAWNDQLVSNGNFGPLQNNKWYRVEIHLKVDDTCTNSSAIGGCNGELQWWFDDTLVINRTNINWGGVKSGIQWRGVWGPREYFHARIPPFGHTLKYDNFVLRTDGQYIGAAANENNLGTPDPLSPYTLYSGIEPFQGGHPAGDCTNGNGVDDTAGSSGTWRSSTVKRNQSMDHAGFLNKCTILPNGSTGSTSSHYVYKPAAMELKGSGGYQWERSSYNRAGANKIAPASVIHGWIYLPSSNDYTQTEALSGEASYDTNNWGNYLAMSINNGKWAVIKKQKNGAANIALQSNINVVFDRWQEFEYITWMDGHVSLMADGVRVYDREPLALPIPNGGTTWDSPTNPSGLKTVLGVIDTNASPPFTVYYDDASLGSASFWSCDGWNPASCPFASVSCGDNMCNGGETCNTCPADCGTCPAQKPGDVVPPGGNGVVDIYDAVYVATRLGQSGISDINNDGTTNIFDLVVLARSWG